MTDLRIPTFPLSPRDVWGLALQDDLVAVRDVADAVVETANNLDARAAALVSDAGTATGGALDARFLTRTALYNATPANLTHWTKGLARQAAGLGAARLGCYGDSITEGYWSTVTSMYNVSYSRRLQFLADLRYGAAGEGPVQFYDNDNAALTFVDGPNGSITQLAGFGWYGQQAQQLTDPGVSHDTYIQLGPVRADTFRLYVIGNAGTTEASVSLDDGATWTDYPTTYTGGGNHWLTIDVPAGALGDHTIRVGAGPSSTNLYLVSIEPIIGSAGVRVFRVGKGGATPAELIDAGSEANAGSLAFAFDAFAPDMSVINLGVNNYLLQSTDVPTYKSQMQTVIDRAKQTGDVLLVTQVPNSDQTITPSQEDYNAAVRDLATTNGCVLLDLYEAWATFANADGLGYMGDVTHPNALGYGAIATLLASALFL